MKEFPDILKPKNKENFAKLNQDRLKCYLRRDLYEHIISHEDKDYFSLDEFNKRANDMNLTKQLVREIIPELEQLGWKCKTSFGGTGLFIYNTENPPPNCFEDSGEFS
jgi:hypothetical protein